MQDGPKPEFLQKKVAYYVMGAEKWRYTESLEAVTSRWEPSYLHSNGNPTDVFHSGTLESVPPGSSEPDSYVYDPRDVSDAALEATTDPENRVDQRMILASVSKQLIYHGVPFEKDTEISGFFRASLWISIDQPDTDFRVSVYEIALDGTSILLSTDSVRARYRESLRAATLIRTREPLKYDFERFTFVSRRVKRGNRLRLVVGPLNSIYSQRNFNGGGDVSTESVEQARTVTVRLFHDPAHPSALYVPLGHSDPENQEA
jgi:hypothetical protein